MLERVTFGLRNVDEVLNFSRHQYRNQARKLHHCKVSLHVLENPALSSAHGTGRHHYYQNADSVSFPVFDGFPSIFWENLPLLPSHLTQQGLDLGIGADLGQLAEGNFWCSILNSCDISKRLTNQSLQSRLPSRDQGPKGWGMFSLQVARYFCIYFKMIFQITKQDWGNHFCCLALRL